MSIIDHNVRSLNKATFFTSFLTLDDDNNANGNYSGGITEFSYTNTDENNTLFIGDLVINIKDDGPFNIGDEYAGTNSALTNGINVFYTGSTGTERKNIIGTTYNIKTTADFLNYTTDVNILSDSTITINLNFQKNRSNIKLGITDKISVELNDDFTGLTEQTISISGFTYANSDLI